MQDYGKIFYYLHATLTYQPRKASQRVPWITDITDATIYFPAILAF